MQNKQMIKILASTCFWTLFFLMFFYRAMLVDDVRAHVRWYASAYICEKIEERELTYNEDVDMLIDRLMPPKLSSAFNLLKWSEDDFVEDKELLSMCREAWERKEAKRIQEEKETKKSFDERLEKWKRKEP